jgi:hypothetical protein
MGRHSSNMPLPVVLEVWLPNYSEAMRVFGELRGQLKPPTDLRVLIKNPTSRQFEVWAAFYNHRVRVEDQ